MPHSQRLILCRTGFVLLCLLPTLAVCGWLVRRASSAYRAAERGEWQRELNGRLGLAVEISALSYPSFDVAVLDNVRLRDPETRAVVYECAAAEVQRTDAGWQIHASQLAVHSRSLSSAAAALHDALLRRGPADLPSIDLHARELTLHSTGGPQTLSPFHARLASGDTGPTATIAFSLPAAQSAAASPVQLTIARHRHRQPPVTWWQLDTAGQSLPLALLGDWFPDVAALGTNCRFDGQMTVSLGSGGWTGQLRGTLQNIDLDALVSEHFPHKLSGLAVLRLDRATFDDGRLIDLAGTLESSGGAISPSLVAASQQHLNLTRAADNATLRDGVLVPITRLSIRFHTDGNQLVLSSGQPEKRSVLLANTAGPILEAPPQHRTAAVNLLRTLLPDNRYLVPATRQTSALVRLFPVPDMVPLADAPRQALHTPTRLAPASPEPTPAVRQPMVR
jgi:hypothetical protein